MSFGHTMARPAVGGNIISDAMTARRPPATNSRPQETAWKGEVATWYDSLVGDEGSAFQKDLIFPQVLRLLELKRGEHILDLGCGQGAFCREAQKAGAEVTGLDASEELVRIARERSRGRGRYVAGDAAHLEVFPPSCFDAVVCILAIQNIDPIEPVMSGVGRVVRPGGRLVLVMNHQSFRIPRQSAWGWDDERKLVYRRVDRYLTPMKIPIQTHPGSKPGLVTWTFHRPLQHYVRALADAGLWVNALEEWTSNKVSQPGARAKAENRARQEIPLFLALRAVKIGERQP